MYKNSEVIKIYLFRHGETFATRDVREYGDQVLTAPILDSGKPAIEKIGRYLASKNIDVFISSEILRCQQTSEIVSQEINKQFVTDPLLNEYYNETFEQMRNRIVKFIDSLNKYKGKTVLVCTHGACLSALKHLLLFGKYELQNLMDFPKPGIIWEVVDGELHEVNFN